jgi:hypothetical protein
MLLLLAAMLTGVLEMLRLGVLLIVLVFVGVGVLLLFPMYLLLLPAFRLSRLSLFWILFPMCVTAD